MFCRLASSIGMERQIQRIAGRRFLLPDGSERYLVDEALLSTRTATLGGQLIDPLKTTVVQNQRSMTTWVMVAPVRQLVAKLVPNRPLSTRVVADIVELQLGGVRTTAVQLTGIAILGLFIAVVGVHGLLAYNVNRRIREIGIRRVLGATTNGVLGLVLGEAARLAAIGVGLGLVLAWIAMRWFQPATGGIGQDQAVYAAAAVLAVIAAVLSAYVPARRAASVSPQEALRS